MSRGRSLGWPRSTRLPTELGISRRQVYVLFGAAPCRVGPSGNRPGSRFAREGIGGGRVDDEVESIIRERLRDAVPLTGCLCVAGYGPQASVRVQATSDISADDF